MNQMALPLYQHMPEYYTSREPIAAPRPVGKSVRKHRRCERLLSVVVVLMLLLCVVVKGIFALAGFAGQAFNSDAMSPRWLSSADSGASISAESVHVRTVGGYITITGAAVNRSARQLSNVEVEAVLKGSGGDVLSLQQALLPQQSIAPGKQAPFRIDMHTAPGTTGFTLHFRKLMGKDLG
jgi:hypothetical protein